MVVLAWQSNAKSHLPQQSSILACRADSESSSVSHIVQIAQGSNYLRERGWRQPSSAKHPCLPATRWCKRNQHFKSSTTALPGPSMGSWIQGVSLTAAPKRNLQSQICSAASPCQWPVAASIAPFQWVLLCISLLVFHGHSSPCKRPSSQSASWDVAGSSRRQAPGRLLQNWGSFCPQFQPSNVVNGLRCG